MQYTTIRPCNIYISKLCYQDFKDTFVCNTQPSQELLANPTGCVIRISKILLYAIHNRTQSTALFVIVVLSGFQRYFCMQYTTIMTMSQYIIGLCYQDFKDTFVCNTQLSRNDDGRFAGCVIRISKILLYAIHNSI